MSMLRLAVHDAANNCIRQNAKATVTLRSGREFTGKLSITAADGDETLRMERPNGGWAIILFEEIAALESHR